MTPALLLLALAATPSSLEVRGVGPMVKIRPGALPAGPAEVRVTAARGECEGVQLLVPPPAKDVRVRAAPLQGSGRAELPIRLYREGFIELREPSNREGAAGPWPDPLIPFGERARADSTAERPLVLYAELCVPAAAKPGSYASTVTVSSGEARAQAKLALTVQPFELPASSSLPNSYGLSLYSIAKGHGLSPESPAAKELLKAYATSLLAHRLSAHGLSMQPPPLVRRDGRIDADFTGYDAELAPFLDGRALPSGARFTTSEARLPKGLSDEDAAAYLAALRRHYDDKRWGAQLFFYAKDEPKPEELPLVLRQAKPVLQVPRLPVLVTSPWDGQLSGVAGVLAPTLNCFFPRPGPQTCRNVQTVAALRKAVPAGTRIWWYQSCNSHGCEGEARATPEVAEVYSGWPSYMVDHPVALNRAMGPLAFREGVDGELYFDTVYAYNAQDPWQSVWAFGGNGDGTLFYPGTPAKLDGAAHQPVESLRLKAIRDGLEDYEYLRLLSACGDKAGAEQAAGRLAPKGYEIARGPELWQSVREQLTRRIAERWTRGECPRGGTVLSRQ